MSENSFPSGNPPRNIPGKVEAILKDPLAKFLIQQGLDLADRMMQANNKNNGNSPTAYTPGQQGYPLPFSRRDETGALRLPPLRRLIASYQAHMRRATRGASNNALRQQFKPLIKDTDQTVKRLQGIVAQIDRIERNEGYKNSWLIIEQASRTRRAPNLPPEHIESFYRLNWLLAKAYQTLQDSIAVMGSMVMDMEAANLTSMMQGETTQFTIARLQKSSAQLRTLAESLSELYENSK